MPPKSKVDLYAAIRRDAHAGLSNRALQRKYGPARGVNAALFAGAPSAFAGAAGRHNRTRIQLWRPLLSLQG